jgi:hypothetical protein
VLLTLLSPPALLMLMPDVAAAGLEIATILQPQWFLIMGSCANMIKGLSWMAGGSTRSVFNLSFVRDNNIAGERRHWRAVRVVCQLC